MKRKAKNDLSLPGSENVERRILFGSYDSHLAYLHQRRRELQAELDAIDADIDEVSSLQKSSGALVFYKQDKPKAESYEW